MRELLPGSEGQEKPRAGPAEGSWGALPRKGPGPEPRLLGGGGEPGVPGCPWVSHAFADDLTSLWGSAAKGSAAAVTLRKDK